MVIAVVGVLMIVYVLVGGMEGTTWVQIIKAVLLIGGRRVDDGDGAGQVWGELLRDARRGTVRGGSGSADQERSPSARRTRPRRTVRRHNLTSQINFISLALALVLGTAGLPHVLMRFYTVPTAKEARRSVVWAIALIGAFYLFTLALGYGAAALVGPDTVLKAPGGQNSAAPLLAFELGGVILLGVISAVAFATILQRVVPGSVSRGVEGSQRHGAQRGQHGQCRRNERRRERDGTAGSGDDMATDAACSRFTALSNRADRPRLRRGR